MFPFCGLCGVDAVSPTSDGGPDSDGCPMATESGIDAEQGQCARGWLHDFVSERRVIQSLHRQLIAAPNPLTQTCCPECQPVCTLLHYSLRPPTRFRLKDELQRLIVPELGSARGASLPAVPSRQNAADAATPTPPAVTS
eukprot:GHVU01126874.1.p2 GENE.GHVU01126874.1~~GHVU01126874.1.p2  ORF type:complete len:140 (-),score=5.08 GHVU01126874.1:390-809(-)